MTAVADAGRAAETVAAHPWLKTAARVGYVVRGFLYATSGVLALLLALGFDVDSEDLRGSLAVLPGGIVRVLILPVVIVGLVAYGAWGFIRAIYDPLNRGDDPPGIVARLGFVWSGINYLAIAVIAAALLVGAVHSDGAGSIEATVNAALSHQAGWIVVIIAGAIGVATGIGQFYDAYRGGWRSDIKRNQMEAEQRLVVDSLGRAGMVARGLVFGMLGWFILQAGIAHDAERSRSMRQVFEGLATSVLGRLILAGLGLGLAAMGLHSVALARWVRMPQSPPRRSRRRAAPKRRR
jgi:hypothetical protein